MAGQPQRIDLTAVPQIAAALTSASIFAAFNAKARDGSHPLRRQTFDPPSPSEASGAPRAPRVGRIARHSCRVATREPNGRVRPMRAAKTTVADGRFRRMARRAQRLHVRDVEVGTTATAGNDVIDMAGGKIAAWHFADRACPQHRRPELPPNLALVERVSGHRRCIQSSQKNRFHPGRAALAAF